MYKENFEEQRVKTLKSMIENGRARLIMVFPWWGILPATWGGRDHRTEESGFRLFIGQERCQEEALRGSTPLVVALSRIAYERSWLKPKMLRRGIC